MNSFVARSWISTSSDVYESPSSLAVTRTAFVANSSVTASSLCAVKAFTMSKVMVPIPSSSTPLCTTAFVVFCMITE